MQKAPPPALPPPWDNVLSNMEKVHCAEKAQRNCTSKWDLLKPNPGEPMKDLLRDRNCACSQFPALTDLAEGGFSDFRQSAVSQLIDPSPPPPPRFAAGHSSGRPQITPRPTNSHYAEGRRTTYSQHYYSPCSNQALGTCLQ